ncbi:MAG: siderophore ABC transporter substrate-binding protein [Microbacterium sp.]|uniref:siderophore ABC transporter substrate-binding protein n=1 Tax=Microbacterium sp. TaxID=51671 RepID=UPI003F9E66D5
MSSRRPLAAASLFLVSALALAACAAGPAAELEAPTSSDEPTTVTVEDNNGSHKIDLPLKSVVATDNRTFETLESWGIELSAAAVSLMPNTNSYTEDEDIIDLGSHREPNLEAVVAVQPDLIINGQRFAQFHDDFVSYAPDAVVLELDPRDGESFEAELKRQTTVLGEVFGKQTEAKELNDALDEAIDRVAAAYDDTETVMAVTTSGGEIGYIAPHVGRTLGPVFDFAGLTPALEVPEATDDHQGDDIAVEAIADSNPDWILVMDRDAAVGADDPNYSPAADILENSEALAKVTAVADGNIVYMPADTYTNEGIQTYTEFLNSFADALEGN